MDHAVRLVLHITFGNMKNYPIVCLVKWQKVMVFKHVTTFTFTKQTWILCHFTKQTLRGYVISPDRHCDTLTIISLKRHCHLFFISMSTNRILCHVTKQTVWSFVILPNRHCDPLSLRQTDIVTFCHFTKQVPLSFHERDCEIIATFPPNSLSSLVHQFTKQRLSSLVHQFIRQRLSSLVRQFARQVHFELHHPVTDIYIFENRPNVRGQHILQRRELRFRDKTVVPTVTQLTESNCWWLCCWIAGSM